jgi:predicted GNAT superfamily acetyltransferase
VVQGAGVGFGLKQHQRDWALERHIDEITWTFDPLLRRNAWFNLMKLGGEVAAYHPNFYGDMIDSINSSDESDRCLIRWRLSGPHPVADMSSAGGREPNRDGSSVVALSEGRAGRPAVDDDPRALAEARWVLCWIPPDVVSMREVDPRLARAWRLALRSSMGAAIRSGLVATGITRDGWYVLERLEEHDAFSGPGESP